MPIQVQSDTSKLHLFIHSFSIPPQCPQTSISVLPCHVIIPSHLLFPFLKAVLSSMHVLLNKII